jgi:predicted DNA-binding WGR domain protein
MFPITIDKLSLRHRSGTKEYHLVLVSNAKGHGLLIKRWGKAGAWGQLQMALYKSATATQAAFDKMRATKESRGYSIEVGHQHTESTDLAGFQKNLGAQYMPEIATHMAYITGDGETDEDYVLLTGLEDDDLPKTADMVKVAQEREAKKRAEREEAKRQKEKEEADLKANPLWGMF